MIELLMHSLRTATTVTLAYAYGTRPGQERQVVVVDIIDDDTAFLVLESGYPERKKYVFNRVLWVRDNEGRVAKNEEQIARYDAFVREKAAREQALDPIVSESGDTIGESTFEVIAEIPSRRSHTDEYNLFALRRGKRGRHTALIRARDMQAANSVCQVLELMNGSSEGQLWGTLGVLIKGKFLWPVWQRYHRDLTLEGQRLRAGQPKLRELSVTRHPDGRKNLDNSHAQYRIYDSSTLRPPSDEDEGGFLDRVRLFEAEPLDLIPLADVAQAVSVRTIAAYFTGASDRWQLQELPSNTIQDDALRELLQASLTMPAKDAPIDFLLSNLNATTLYAPIKARKGKPVSYGVTGYLTFYSEHLDAEMELELRNSKWLDGKYILRPPASWSWEQLQDFRTCYVEMLRALKRWLCGDYVGAAGSSHFKMLI
ncbi:hypothetical protein JJQ59_04825 [Cupriavidus necator]|uniref:hypothetical protein n=1 Tax=Cupriavidus necator TaxID=106590 RepID=UPI0011BD8349|nr:hypothetical protein [Cupriavidus necator]QQX85268.1 hypothetical protein JJQ59_04825 [Cupriavidus necator]